MNDRVANLLGAVALNVADLTWAEVQSGLEMGSSASAALVALDETPDVSVTDLGRHIGLSQPATARMVDGLEAKGLVERRPGGGRTVAVRLTDTGRDTVGQVLRLRGQVLHELVDGFDPSEQAVLADFLARLLHRVHGRVGSDPSTLDEHVAEVVCRLCDRGACRHGGAPCPVTQAQHGDADAGPEPTLP